MTERQRLQQLSRLFPFQSGFPGSNKTRRLRRKRIKFMESWIAAMGFWLPTIPDKTLYLKPITSLDISNAFMALKECYDGSARYINS